MDAFDATISSKSIIGRDIATGFIFKKQLWVGDNNSRPPWSENDFIEEKLKFPKIFQTEAFPKSFPVIFFGRLFHFL